MSVYDIILFDLDGTLTEPKKGITRSFQYALAGMGIIEEDTELLQSFIGPPLKSTFLHHYKMEEEEAMEAVRKYREYFSSKGMYENEVYKGVEDMLEKLYLKKRRLLVATSKATVYAEKILEHFGLRKYFEHVVGSNFDGSRAEKFEIIRDAMLLVRPGPTDKPLMVGDRKHDIIGAQRNFIDTAAVTYGYGSIGELQEARAMKIFNSVAELAVFLGGY